MTETSDEFLAWWAKHCAEWEQIRSDMIAVGKTPSANEVTLEQYRLMNARGESVFAARRRIQEAIEAAAKVVDDPDRSTGHGPKR